MNNLCHYPSCRLLPSHGVMLRRLILLLVISLLLASPMPTTQAQSNAIRGAAVVAVAVDAPPFAIQAANGQIVGFDLDLIKMLARTAGLDIIYEAAPLNQLIPGVATQLYDAAIGCLVATDEQKALVDFSAPYFTSGTVLAFSENSAPLYDLTDLTPEMTVSAVAESESWRFLTKESKADVLAVASPTEALELAAIRATDAAFVDEIAVDRFIRTRADAHLRVVSGLVTTAQCAIAVSKENPHLLLDLNAALVRLKNNGKYLAIYRRWFGSRPLTGPRPVSRPTLVTDGGQGTIPATVSTSSGQDTMLANSAIGAYAITLKSDPSAYQLIELAPNGLWLESLAGPSADAIRGVPSLTAGQLPVQQGRWQAMSADPLALTIQISATLHFSPTLDSSANTSAQGSEGANTALPSQPHKAYQLTIHDDGTIHGAYTLYKSVTPTATLTISETVELSGHLVVQ